MQSFLLAHIEDDDVSIAHSSLMIAISSLSFFSIVLGMGAVHVQAAGRIRLLRYCLSHSQDTSEHGAAAQPSPAGQAITAAKPLDRSIGAH